VDGIRRSCQGSNQWLLHGRRVAMGAPLLAVRFQNQEFDSDLEIPRIPPVLRLCNSLDFGGRREGGPDVSDP
jgi:hypothetical protein